MKRKVAAVFLVTSMIIVSMYIQKQIDAYNMNYYSGKDDGITVQLESILVFNVTFYVLISNKNRIVFGILGLIMGIVTSLLTLNAGAQGILFPIATAFLSVAGFYLAQYIVGQHFVRSSDN